MNASNADFKLPDLKRITIFIGAYGSGKSEISVNFARWLQGSGKPVTLCDLDIINPFYRSSDARSRVESLGIKLVAPQYAGTNVDVPAISGEVFTVFDQTDHMAVLDIGGEDLGARVIASLLPRMQAAQGEVAVYMVVNPFRPFTDSAEKIVEVARELAMAAKIPINGLVDNANLLEFSNLGLIDESWPIVEDAARQLALPVVFAAAMSEAVPAGWGALTSQGVPLLRLERSIWYPV